MPPSPAVAESQTATARDRGSQAVALEVRTRARVGRVRPRRQLVSMARGSSPPRPAAHSRRQPDHVVRPRLRWAFEPPRRGRHRASQPARQGMAPKSLFPAGSMPVRQDVARRRGTPSSVGHLRELPMRCSEGIGQGRVRGPALVRLASHSRRFGGQIVAPRNAVCFDGEPLLGRTAVGATYM